MKRDVLAAFREVTGLPLTSHKDKALGQWIAKHPGRVLDILESSTRNLQLGCFKLFAKEMPLQRFEKHLVSRPGTCFLMLERNPIDSFISFQKAKHAGIWLRSDTTNKQIDISVGDFLEWHEKHGAWLRGAREIVARAGKPMAEMRYEADFLNEEEETLSRLYEALDSMGLSLDLRPRTQALVVLTDLHKKTRAALGMSACKSGALGLKKQDRALNRSTRLAIGIVCW